MNRISKIQGKTRYFLTELWQKLPYTWKGLQIPYSQNPWPGLKFILWIQLIIIPRKPYDRYEKSKITSSTLMTPQFIDTISIHVLRRKVCSPSTCLLVSFKKTHYLDTGGTTFHRSAQHDLRVLWSFQLYCCLPNPHRVWYVLKGYGESMGTNTRFRLDGLHDGMGITIENFRF